MLDLDLADTAGVRRFLLAEFSDWDEEFRSFLTDNDGDFGRRSLHALPAPLVWDGVTPLGDAGVSA